MKKLLYILISITFLQSCRTYKDVLLFQNIEQANINEKNLEYINEYKLKPGDNLSINISVTNKELLAPFIINPSSNININGGNTRNSGLMTYTIDKNGYIDMPELGKIKLAELTRTEAINLLSSKLENYLKNPIVNILINNFRVTVLGSAGGKVVNIQNQNTNILEVLAESGELNESSEIDNILLIREENGLRKKYTINLKNADLFNQPYYFVKQNDIIYIKPSRASTFKFNNAPFAVVSTVLSLGITIYALFLKK